MIRLHLFGFDMTSESDLGVGLRAETGDAEDTDAWWECERGCGGAGMAIASIGTVSSKLESADPFRAVS